MEEKTDLTSKQDIVPKLSKFLDMHLIFPLLEFLSSKKENDKQTYNENDLLKVKLSLLNKTNMVDFAVEVYRKFNDVQDAPEEFHEKRTRVVNELMELQNLTDPTLTILMREDVTQQIENLNDGKQLFDYVAQNHGVTQENVEDLFRFAKFQYECGNYAGASQYLTSHRLLIQPQDKLYLSNLWGKLACEILMQQWEHALEDFNRLKDFVDSFPYFSPLELLQQRTWLIHWSLFIFFSHPQGKEMLIEMLLEKKGVHHTKPQPYLNAVQTICPHILRYLTVAVITHRNRRDYMKELVRVIQQETYTYRDSITEFVECLCVNFDFDSAQKKLKECSQILDHDFFLVALQDEFIDNARLFVFEIFCQIHECISISMLAEKLNMTPDEAEKWIVNLITQARLDARIDSKLGHVVMGAQAISPYQQLVEKSKAMSIRSNALISNLEKRQVLERPNWHNKAQDF